MQIDFAHRPPSRVGIEWELACVDRGSGELAGVAPEILRSFPDDDAHPHVTGEFLTNTVEVVSAPHARVGHAVDDLARLIERVVDVADPLGIDLMCAGTHPFSAWPDQDVTPDNERYATLLDRTRWWGRQMMIWGVHVHVGIDDASKALPILNALLVHLPRFQALSASSPFWSGQETGYASNRALMFQQLPTAGLPPELTTWADYERLVADMTHVGVIDHHSELRWDIRPAPKWGTLETRVFDGVSTLAEIASLAALVQCLVHDMSAALDRGEELPRMQPWFVRENKWRAARYGMDAIIIQDAAGDEALVGDDTRALVERLSPTADALGCEAELRGILDIVDRGASYQRQLRVAEENDGALAPVVTHLVEELRSGLGR